MTNAIERSKQSMYKWLEAAKRSSANVVSEHSISMKWLEETLEAYLEELRLDHEALHVTARERFDSIRSLEQANKELQQLNDTQYETIRSSYRTAKEMTERLAAMTQERDDIQGRLHAIDHAYDKSQRANGVAGYEIRRLQTLVQLYKEQSHTQAQDSKENSASEQPDTKALMIVLGALVDAQRIVTDWLVPDGIKAKKAMAKLLPVLDNQILVGAQKVFEVTGSDVTFGVDAGTAEGDYATLAWRCWCGNFGSTRIEGLTHKQWNCLKCNASHEWYA